MEFSMNTLFAVISYVAGLQSLWNDVLSGWVKPLFLAAVAVIAIKFLLNRSWTKLIGFVGIAAIVGLLIFAGDALFGSADSGLTGVAKGAVGKVNIVNTVPNYSNAVTLPDTDLLLR